MLRTTLAESGENLVRGLKMLAEDIEAGHGKLRIRQSDARGVQARRQPRGDARQGDLPQRADRAHPVRADDARGLQAAAADRAAVDQQVLHSRPQSGEILHPLGGRRRGSPSSSSPGSIPDERHADKDFDSYMREGILAALDAVEQATGEREVAAIGYCVGGTLLAATLAYMAAVGDKRITSATFFAAQIDFTDAGDLKVFVDDEQLKAVEERMAETRLSRRLADGERLQHAAAERPDLVLLRQQLSEGQRADAVRPPGLELGLDPHARRQPQVLPAALLPAERSRERAHGARAARRSTSRR